MLFQSRLLIFITWNHWVIWLIIILCFCVIKNILFLIWSLYLPGSTENYEIYYLWCILFTSLNLIFFSDFHTYVLTFVHYIWLCQLPVRLFIKKSKFKINLKITVSFPTWLIICLLGKPWKVMCWIMHWIMKWLKLFYKQEIV